MTAIVCLAALPWTTLQAQTSATDSSSETVTQIPDKLTREQVRDLVAHLSDEELRELIIAQLDKQAVADEQVADPEVYISQLLEGINVGRDALSRIFSSGDRIYELPASIWAQLTNDGQVSYWYPLMQLVGMLLAGLAAEYLLRRLFSRAATRPRAGSSKRLEQACYGLVTGILHLGAFFIGAILFIEISSGHLPASQSFWNELAWCLVLIRLVALAVRQLSLDAPGLASPSSGAAQQMVAWSVLLSAALILPQPLVSIASSSGADTDTALLISVVFGALFILLVIVLLIRLRNYGAALILGEGGDVSSIRLGLARNWWILAIVYVLLIWFMSMGKRAATGESSMLPGIGSLVLLALIPFIDSALKALITWYFADQKEPERLTADDGAAGAQKTAGEPVADAQAETVLEPVSVVSERAPAYIAIALRYARAVVVLFVLMAFVQLWNIDVRALSAQLIGPRFASALFDISITVLLTWALWGMIRISIERKLDQGKPADAEAEGESEAGGMGGSRVETVLPLIRVSIKITLVIMAVLISLSSLGVNIGPLIAGAGVIGIAIGFGAQTLVRDIVSGFFYLLDDAFRIGEYVVIDQIRGTVEKISVRSFQLRHHNGPVHTIPYGEIRTLTNWSRDWAIMKFELRIPFETDIDQVRKIIKQIGIDMMADPVFGPLMLAPLKSQGVNRMDDSALIIRCKFTAIPGQQYLIRREAFTRIQRVFEEKGIQFAPRRVLVEASTPAEAINAAAGVLDQEKQNNTPKDSL